MAKFIFFDDSLINTDQIACIFKSISETHEYCGHPCETYTIVVRLTNNGRFEEQFCIMENRDERFNELNNILTE